MIDVITTVSLFVVGGIIGYFIGAHNASSAKKQQKILEDKI